MSTSDALGSTEGLIESHYSIDEVVTSDRSIPPLENGDRLPIGEFLRRYDAMPNLKKAELIEGEVFMGSPVRFRHHAQPHAHVVAWLGQYTAKTPGLAVADNVTSCLDNDNSYQPDALLLLPSRAGGGAHLNEKDLVAGAPDLVCEIAASNVSIALGKKLNVYRRNGVREYLVVRTEDQAVDWFQLVEGNYAPMTAHEDGLLKSQLFPGLWLNATALLAGDLPKLFAAVDQGTATDEHKAFIQKLADAIAG